MVATIQSDIGSCNANDQINEFSYIFRIMDVSRKAGERAILNVCQKILFVVTQPNKLQLT